MLTVIKKIHCKNRVQLFWLYTISFVITSCIAFFPFIISGTSLVWNPDGMFQHYGNLAHLKLAIHEFLSEGNFSFWSWSTGLGADYIGSMVSMGYSFFDVFSLIAAMFPEEQIALGYTVSVFLQLYAAGLGFLYLGKVTDMCFKHTLWGALAYALSLWAIILAGCHGFFLTPLVLLAFIMAGVEKVLRQQSPLVLILAVFYQIITSLYFSYMTAIIVFVYLLVSFSISFFRGGDTFKEIACYLGKYILYVTIAACLAAVIMIPGMYTLVHTAKDGGTSLSLFHPFSYYVNFLSFLIGGQEMISNYSIVCVVSLFLILIPAIIHRICLKNATPAMITFVICLVFLLFPVFCSMFNGFGYPMGRWCYIPTFFYVWSGLQCLEAKNFDIRKYRTGIAVMLALFGVMLFFVGRIVLNINNETTTIIGVVNLAFAVVFYCLLAEQKEKKRVQCILVTLAVMANIISVGIVSFFPGISSDLDTHLTYGEMHQKLQNSTQRAGTEIKDDDFYRIDQIDYISALTPTDNRYTNISYRPTHATPNETLVFNTRSIYTYLSSVSGDIFDFYKGIGNSASLYQRVCTYGNDNRTRLDFLMGVKYFLGNNPKNSPPTGANEYASYGFSSAGKSSLGVDILQNKYSIGLGCTYDSYITETEWMLLDYPDREQALMQCVVLPDDMDTSLTHANVQSISAGAKRAACHVTGATGVSSGGQSLAERQDVLGNPGTFRVSQANGTFTLHLDGDYKNHEMYFLARNLRRDSESTSEMKYSASSGMSRINRLRAQLTTGKNYDDCGGFIMKVESGGIFKRAINPAGDPQGFSDIEDYMINLGEYRENAKDIKITLDTIGEYNYDSIEILAVPLSTYESCVETCIRNTYDISTFSDNYVKGTVETAQDSSILYLSIPYHDGWRAYVDGEEVQVQPIDVTFSGVPVSGAGSHTVELRYRPVGFEFGIVAFVIGVIACVVVCLRQRDRNR